MLVKGQRRLLTRCLQFTQVLVRWAVQRGTSVLPKSTDPERIVANFAVLDWSLDGADLAALSGLEYQARMVDGSFLLSPAGPYKCVVTTTMHALH